VVKAIVTSFSHLSMITPCPLLRVIISGLVLTTRYVSDLSLRSENLCLIISTSTLLARVDSQRNTISSATYKIDKLMVLHLFETLQSP